MATAEGPHVAGTLVRSLDAASYLFLALALAAAVWFATPLNMEIYHLMLPEVDVTSARWNTPVPSVLGAVAFAARAARWAVLRSR